MKFLEIWSGNMNRRNFVRLALAGTIATAARKCRGGAATTPTGWRSDDFGVDDDLQARWKGLDSAIRGWWVGDLHHSTENEIRNDPGRTLLFLPFPYITAGGSESAFPEIYGWDTQFINLGLLAHDRADIVRWNILDQLSMIERFGKVLNGNRTFYATRGQPPLLAWSVENYLEAHKEDDELAMLAYPNLERAYREYWNGPDHITPIGLSTCRDSGTGSEFHSEEGPRLSAECEAGLDFTPIFDGDIRRCVPLHINCALVRQAQILGALAERFGWDGKAEGWKKEAGKRAGLINQYCWDESEGFYFEYDYVRQKRLPFYSLNAYWPLWAGIASKSQAEGAVSHLKQFDRPYGLTFTDKDYPNPHPEFKALEWAYPESWPPQQIIVALALKQYGFLDEARRVNRRYISNVVTTWEQTGTTWERYNAVLGGYNCPVERTAVARLHGWSSSSAVVIGRMLFS
jgi:alpha,alpha-trehalase